MATLNITIPDADETTKGIAEVATQAETDAGIDDTKIVTPNKLANWSGGGGGQTVTIQYGNWAGSGISDGTTYKVAQQVGLTTGANGFARIPIPAGTVNKVYISTYNASTFGSSEALTVRLLSDDGTNDDTLSTTIMADARHYYEAITGLGITTTDNLSWIEFDVPVMATNPASFQLRVTLLIEV